MPSAWSNCEFDAGDPNIVNSATSFPPANCNNFFSSRLRDARAKRNQYGSTGFASSYCGGDDYYNCSSSYYYGGGNGCSESMNCDYYRYQQNSSYYHHNNGYSSYSNLHAGYANGYHYSKDHSERYNSMVSNGDMTCGMMSQNCQMDKYHYSTCNEEHQIPYHYGDKQSSMSYHQYQPYMPHNQHQLPSQPGYNNYNGYNSYAPVSSFGYF